MNQVQFDIELLTCAYQSARPVLMLRNVKIPRRKLVFVIGLSGVGKSTFIEALGLMNNVFDRSADNRVYFFDEQNTQTEIGALWQGNNQLISNFRNHYFSFIFQNTNLMHNFTAGENMCISQMISGKSIKVAKQTVLDVMNKLNLPPEVFDKKVSALSGGQRQRLAFVRAITARFEVLFGDEPTGNLDKDTGYRMMEVLKKHLHEKEKTGIIVSHDLELALYFGDEIIMLTPATSTEGVVYGTIETSKCMTKNGTEWLNGDGITLHNPLKYIHQTLNISIPLDYA